MMSGGKTEVKPEILVVEDSRTQAELLGHLLEGHGYAVITASNGRQALSRVHQSKPALIISDIVMPEMDGYELCRQIKNDPDLKQIPVILLTQLSSPAVIIKGLQCEADNFIIKPYDGEYLLSRIVHTVATLNNLEDKKTRRGVDVFFAGKEYSISSERQQILDLFLSTYEAAVQKDMDLVRTRDKLENLNEKLEEMVKQRTAALRVEIEGHKEAVEALRQSEKRLRHLSSQLLTAQETERRRIANELHDSVAASLGAVVFCIEKILSQVGEKENVRGELKDLISKVQQVNQETRRIMSALRPAILDDLGIVPAMNWLIREYENTYSHISVEKRIDISEEDLTDALKTAIFRVSQEAMNNIAKHGNATLVSLRLQKGKGGIELTIRDNGQGFEPDTAKKGLGLSTMRERTEFLGGTCMIESVQGEGTTIRCLWPI